MMLSFERVKKAPGVYLMLDLDDKPVYAGQATNLRHRLLEHFVKQRSDVLTDVLLDIYEVRSVAIWYAVKEFALPLRTDDDDDTAILAKRHPLDILEAALLKRFNPRWNRANKTWAGDHPPLTLEICDDVICLLEGLELDIRKDTGQRMEANVLHILRAVRKVRISGGSTQVRLGLHRHIKELDALCRRGIR